MGDPRKIRRKFSRPGHPWNKERIEAEAIILREYGLKNKKEIWKITSRLRDITGQAKRLIATRGTQEDKERDEFLAKLRHLGIVSATATLDDVLGITLKQLLERRLQTLLVRKQLARTHNQSRQFIAHGHVRIGEKKVTSPAHLVRVHEETTIGFLGRSSLQSPEHPERTIIAKASKTTKTGVAK